MPCQTELVVKLICFQHVIIEDEYNFINVRIAKRVVQRMRVLKYIKGPLLPGAHSIERFLVEEDLQWIIEQNIWNKKEW